MNVVRILVVAVVVLLGAAPQVGAQGFKWWQDEKSKAKLGLSVDQVAKIEEIFQAAGPQMRSAWEEFSRQDKLLSALIEKPETTEADVMRLSDKVENLRAELGKARTLMIFRMNRLLSAEQRVKVKELHDSRERGRSRPPGERK